MRFDSYHTIPDGWAVVTLKKSRLHVIDGDRGKNYPKKSELKKDGFCIFLNNKNIINDELDIHDSNYIEKGKDEVLNNGKLSRGDIVLSTRGSVGNVGYFHKGIKEKNIRINSGMVIIRNNGETGLITEYLYQLMKSPIMKNQYKEFSSGSVQKQLPIRDINKLKIIYPKSIAEQQSIAHFLSKLDNMIKVNSKLNKNLEEMAQAIFKHWFVDFEFPDENGNPYKSSGGEMIESELGRIPKGWKVESLDQIADYLNGLAMQKYRPDQNENGIPVLKIKELRQGFTDQSSALCSKSIDPKYIVQDGDVIFSWSGSLLLRIWCGGTCGLNQHLFKVSSAHYRKWFYYYWTMHYLNKFIHIAKDKATTMGHIKRKDLTDSMVVVPDLHIYRNADQILSTLLEQQIKLREEIKKLVLIRDTLLPKLMSGEIRVPTEQKVR